MSKILEFQKNNGLLADGVLGKKTFEKMKSVWKIDSDKKLASFLGQLSHESGNFNLDKENLNYSKVGLLGVFKKYFTPDFLDKNGKNTFGTASIYQRNPEKIANKVYANRMGNGDEKSGDGWKHRGAGGLQLTGANNYQEFSKWVGSEKKLTTDEIANKYFWETGLFYFEKNKLWNIASNIDDDSIELLSIKINGGINGLKDRIEKTNSFYNLIKK